MQCEMLFTCISFLRIQLLQWSMPSYKVKSSELILFIFFYSCSNKVILLMTLFYSCTNKIVSTEQKVSLIDRKILRIPYRQMISKIHNHKLILPSWKYCISKTNLIHNVFLCGFHLSIQTAPPLADLSNSQRALEPSNEVHSCYHAFYRKYFLILQQVF